MSILTTLRAELKTSSDQHTLETGSRFFKEAVQLYGVTVPRVGQIAREHFQHVRNQPKTEIWELCEELWKSGYLEESFIACHWSYAIRRQYEPADFRVFTHWVDQYVTNWASCDTLCNHTIGEFVTVYPDYLAGLKSWATSRNRWMRRAAAVSLIVPARQGKYLPEILAIADILLLDTDDLVQKGYGWMLKAASQAHPMEVFQYVMAHKATMPRTSLRYAIEKLPPDLKTQAMAKKTS